MTSNNHAQDLQNTIKYKRSERSMASNNCSRHVTHNQLSTIWPINCNQWHWIMAQDLSTFDFKKGSGRLRGSILGAWGFIFASPGLPFGRPGLPSDPFGADTRHFFWFVRRCGVPRGLQVEKYTPTCEQKGAKMIPEGQNFIALFVFCMCMEYVYA